MIAYNLNEKDVYQFRFAKGGNSPLLFFGYEYYTF
jgi:hypothetical protein